MGEYKKLFKNSIIFAVGNMCIKIIQFVLMPLLTFVFTKEEFAQSELLVNIIDLALPILLLGIAEAVFRFTMDKDANVKSVFTNTICVCAFAIIFASGIISIVSIFDSREYWLLLAVLFAVMVLDACVSQFVKGIGKLKLFSISGIMQAILLLGFSLIFLLWLDMGVNGYLLALICAATVKILFMSIFSKIFKYFSIKQIDKKLLKAMLKFSLPLIPNAVSWWVLQLANKYVVLGAIDGATAGLYSAAAKLPALINVATNIFMQAFTISAINNNKDYEFNTNVFKLFSCGMIAISSMIIFILPLISKIVLLGEFYEAWSMSAMLILGAFFGGIASFYGAFFTASKENKFVFISTVAGAILNILFCVFTIKYIGVYAALIASVISNLLIAIIRAIASHKYSQIKYNFIKVSASVILLLTQVLIVTITEQALYLVQGILVLLVLIVWLKEIVLIFKFGLEKIKKR